MQEAMKLRLDSLPDDAEVTLKVHQLKAMIRGEEREPFDGVGTSDAAKITDLDVRTLRRLWKQWDRIQKDGGRPEVRVSRKSSSPYSDLLFDRNDLVAYRASHGGGPRPVDSAPAPPKRPPAGPTECDDPNDVEAISNKLLEKS